MPGNALLLGASDDLVIYVGEVLDVGDLTAGELQPAANHVEDHVAAGVAHVAVVVGGDPADVEAHLSRGEWDELFLAASEGVVDLHDYPTIMSSRAERGISVGHTGLSRGRDSSLRSE